MRILHIGKYYPPFAGGMETFLADLLGALSRQGQNVAALVHHQDRDTRGQWPADDATIPIFRAPTYGRLLYAPLSPAFPWWLHRTIRAFRPDLLHLHLPNTSAFAALAVPLARRLPWVVHWHSDVVASTLERRLRLAYTLYRPFEQRLLANSQAIVATSQPYLEASAALRPWREHCRVIPLGLDAARLPAPAPAAIQEAETLWGNANPRVLAIGRLTYYKGHEVLIEALAQLPTARGIIIGSGERQEALAALSTRLGLEHRLTLTGFQPDALLSALLASCDLLCLPSLERTEAFGVVLLEAMHHSKPVIVSDIAGSGCGWVVRQARNGLLVRPGGPNDLARAIAALGDDATRRTTLGMAGKRALTEQFGIARVAEATAQVYAEVLDARASANTPP